MHSTSPDTGVLTNPGTADSSEWTDDVAHAPWGYECALPFLTSSLQAALPGSAPLG